MNTTILLQHAANQISRATINSGRSCILGKKFLSRKIGLEWTKILVRDYTIPSTPGSGAGKGGGAGGSVRESGGGLGQFGAAKEEEFFYLKKKEQLEKLKAKLKDTPKSPELSQKKND